MNDALKADCSGCGCPDQHVGLPCGFCRILVAKPGSMRIDGTAAVDEVIGFRGWEVRGSGNDVRLHSPLRSEVVWIPGQWMMAECTQHGKMRYGGSTLASASTRPGYHGSDAPDKENWSPVKGCGGAGHGCGFYAARTREHLVGTLPEYVRYSEGRPAVIGRVQMAGKIILASNGFRAQKVRPLTLYVPFELWEIGRDLKAVYEPHGVEVKLETTIVLPKDEIQWCLKCKAKMNRSTTCPFCGHRHK